MAKEWKILKNTEQFIYVHEVWLDDWKPWYSSVKVNLLVFYCKDNSLWSSIGIFSHFIILTTVHLIGLINLSIYVWPKCSNLSSLDLLRSSMCKSNNNWRCKNLTTDIYNTSQLLTLNPLLLSLKSLHAKRNYDLYNDFEKSGWNCAHYKKPLNKLL